jgi:membrane-associated PAP2 superfamily phosphatase
MKSPFWRRHLWWPLAVFGLLSLAVAAGRLDHRLAGLLFDTRTGTWLGAGAGDWWAHRLLHDQGRWLVRGITAGALALWISSFVTPALRPWRASAGFVALAILLAVGIVGGLKALTNVDCPWDIAGFGGHNPLVPLLADRPDYLPRARCFPGAHSSSGFALFCFYFLWKDDAPRRARWALAAALLTGFAFAAGQEARGAHFLSHDLASAAIVWLVQLLLYSRTRMPAAKRAARADVPPRWSGRRRLLLGRRLATEQPQDATHHDHRDADAIAHARTPIVHPAHQREFHVDHVQHE